jgi:hypothetical protein
MGCALTIGTFNNLAPLSEVRGKLNAVIEKVDLLSPPHFASLFTQGNSTETPISEAGGFVKAVVDTSTQGPDDVGFAVSANRLTYSGPTRVFAVDVLATETGAHLIDVGFRIAKNGTSAATSEVSITMPVPNWPQTVKLQGIFTLEDGDYLELFVANLSDTENLTVRMLNMRVIQLGG